MLHALLIGALSAGLHLSSASAVSTPVLEGGGGGGVRGGGPAAIADSVVIEKAAHKLILFHLGRAIRTYKVALGRNPVGDKVSAGDHRTPEGLFSIDSRNPQSHYHLSLHISYPDARHRAKSAALGVSPGGDIMIHGLPIGRHQVGANHRIADWTFGCVALTDEEIEEIWSVVPNGTPVEIKK